MFSRLGSAAFKKDLTNIRILCERLGNPQNRFKTIHVGGTNGKGSVSHMLAAVLQSAGYRTGLYTSPHLYDFRERIRINGQLIDEAFVISFVEKVTPWIEEIQPSFFEITVAMAFAYFAEMRVKVAVIEVGLGGRLDSTNIITPILSVITNIGWDHMNMLGNTLPEIAFEKAGIIKHRVPVVIGEKSQATAFVFQRIAQKNESPILYATDRFVVQETKPDAYSMQVKIWDARDIAGTTYQLGLPGIYQQHNLVTVLQAIKVLSKKLVLKPDAIHNGIAQVKSLTGLLGRWEVIQEKPMVVLEVAHNRNGLEQMLQHTQQLNFRQLHIVFGMVKDKDAESILSLLPKDACYYFTQAHIPRALPAPALQAEAAGLGLQGDCYPDVNEALASAKSKAGDDDLVIVCGSIFLVAEVKRD